MVLTNMIKLGALGFKPDDIRKIQSSGIDSDSIVELAKNGYTAKDVDELIALTKEDVDTTTEETKHEPKMPDDGSNADGDDDKFDYKKELETRDAKIAEMEKQVSDLQNLLAGKKLADTPNENTRAKVQEAFKNLY